MRRAKVPRVQLTCIQCGKPYEIYPSHAQRGTSKFCSIGCGTRWRNLHNNPTKDPEVRRKISQNHANVSGKNNPMYGRSGEFAPGYKDPLSRSTTSKSNSQVWRAKAFYVKSPICEVCGKNASEEELHVHHKDKNRSNNDLDNLQVVCVWCHNNVMHPRERDQFGRFFKEVI